MLLRLLLLVGGTVAVARALPSLAPAGSLTALLLTLVGVPVVVLVGAWLGIRRARTPTRVLVSRDGLALEATTSGIRSSWRWEELRMTLLPDEEDGTLVLRGPFHGEVLVGRDRDSSMAPLVDAIRRAGGTIHAHPT